MKKIIILFLINAIILIFNSCSQPNENEEIVAIKTFNNLFVTVDGENNGIKLIAKSNEVGEWETFSMTKEGQKIKLKSNSNLYVCANLHEGCFLYADRKNAYDWETFTMEALGNNKIALKAFNGKYVSVCEALGGLLIANKDSVGKSEQFSLIENP